MHSASGEVVHDGCEHQDHICDGCDAQRQRGGVHDGCEPQDHMYDGCDAQRQRRRCTMNANPRPACVMDVMPNIHTHTHEVPTG